MNPIDWKPLRAASRRMSLMEAYIAVENQRDLLSLYMASNKILTIYQKDKIYQEILRMNKWLFNKSGKIKVKEVYIRLGR